MIKERILHKSGSESLTNFPEKRFLLHPFMRNISPRAFSFLLFVFILISVSCERQDVAPPVPEFKYNGDKKAEALIAADNEFGLDLFRLIAEDDECPVNMMMSPVSVAMALGMTYNGAGGDTKTAFEETLRLQNFSREEINNIHQALIDYLLKADPKVIFEIANSIWYRLGFDVLQAFIDVNKKHYYADVRELDFNRPDAVKIINDWCAANTRDKVQEVLDYIPGNAVMYLINALYFNGMWKYEFNTKDSQAGNFFGEDGGIINVTYMKNEGSFRYFQNDLMSSVELPYGNGNFVMNIFLPVEGKKIPDIFEILDKDNWEEWMGSYVQREEVVVQLPRFKYEYKTLLNKQLKEMGLTIAFEGPADFSGICPAADLFISRVIHQTFIDVNEKGTEAAAVTVVEIREKVSLKTDFKVERPFIYIIREKNTGALLFMGKVEKPEYK